MRPISSLYFLLRFIVLSILVINGSSVIIITILFASTLLIAILRPYKKYSMNTVDTLVLTNLTFVIILIQFYIGVPSTSDVKVYFLLEILGLSSLPMVGVLSVLVFKFSPCKSAIEKQLKLWKLCKTRTGHVNGAAVRNER